MLGAGSMQKVPGQSGPCGEKLGANEQASGEQKLVQRYQKESLKRRSGEWGSAMHTRAPGPRYQLAAPVTRQAALPRARPGLSPGLCCPAHAQRVVVWEGWTLLPRAVAVPPVAAPTAA